MRAKPREKSKERVKDWDFDEITYLCHACYLLGGGDEKPDHFLRRCEKTSCRNLAHHKITG